MISKRYREWQDGFFFNFPTSKHLKRFRQWQLYRTPSQQPVWILENCFHFLSYKRTSSSKIWPSTLRTCESFLSVGSHIGIIGWFRGGARPPPLLLQTDFLNQIKKNQLTISLGLGFWSRWENAYLAFSFSFLFLGRAPSSRLRASPPPFRPWAYIVNRHVARTSA